MLGLWAAAPLLPLFSRVEKDKALENPRRLAILSYVETNPGARFHEVKRDLDLPHGVLVHHLRVLRAQGLLVEEREGRSLRLRRPGVRIGPRLEPAMAPLLGLVRARPEVTIRESSEALGWPPWVTSYRASILARQGFVLIDGHGGRRRLRPAAPLRQV